MIESNRQTIVMIGVNNVTVWLQLVDIFLNVRGSAYVGQVNHLYGVRVCNQGMP